MTDLVGESRNRAGRKASGVSGVATVEMALMLPFLLLTVIGIIDVSRAAFVGMAVANAASAGALYGAQGPGYAVDTSAVLAAATADAQVSGMTISSSTYCECSDGSTSTCLADDCGGSRRMDYIQVDTSADWVPIFNYPGIPGTVTLNGRATVQIAE